MEIDGRTKLTIIQNFEVKIAENMDQIDNKLKFTGIKVYFSLKKEEEKNITHFKFQAKLTVDNAKLKTT